MMSYLLLFATGMSKERLAHCHESTRQRALAFALALLIPLVSWSLSGFVIAHQLFMLDVGPALAVSAVCTLVVYCVERLIILSPDRWYMLGCRLFIATVAAILVASAVDICLFAREIAVQIRADAHAALVRDNDAARRAQEVRVRQLLTDWKAAVANQNCEANGSCGSARANMGPIWRELDRQSRQLRREYEEEVLRLDRLQAEHAAAEAAVAKSESVVREAGLLARIEALHRYNRDHDAAQVTYLLLFLLVVALECIVVLVKVAFGMTIDDRIERGRERLAGYQLDDYLHGVLEPEGRALSLIEQRA